MRDLIRLFSYLAKLIARIVMRNTHYFTAHPSRLDTAQDISYTLVAGWVNLAKDSNPGD